LADFCIPLADTAEINIHIHGNQWCHNRERRKVGQRMAVEKLSENLLLVRKLLPENAEFVAKKTAFWQNLEAKLEF